MITNLDPASELFLAQVGRVQDRLARASREVSSGKRIAFASDAPDQIEPLLQLRAAQAHNAQLQSNLSLAKADADAADGALAGSINLMDRALVLASQGASTTLDASGRQSLAEEVRSLVEQMVSQSATTVQGRYIFSGNDYSEAAYRVDWTAPDNVQQITAAPANIRIEGPGGSSFAASKNAQEIFDLRNSDGTPASGNVFAALSSLLTALENNDPDAAASAIPSLHAASDHLNTMEAFYGTVQHRVDDAVDTAGKVDIQLKTQISDREDADVVAAASEATQASTQLSAAFQMKANLPHTSLFDYLG